MSNTRYPRINLKDIMTIKNTTVAYFLGFIAADGCIRIDPRGGESLSFSLKREDRFLLEEFKKIFHCHAPIFDYAEHKWNKKYEGSRLICYQKGIVSCFKKWNIVPRKTKILKFPAKMPKKYIRHFIRGYWDGDGCFSFTCIKRPNYTKNNIHISVSGASKDFMKELAEILKINQISYGESFHKKSRTYRIMIHRGSFKDFYKFLYRHSRLYLKRKKLIADKILLQLS